MTKPKTAEPETPAKPGTGPIPPMPTKAPAEPAPDPKAQPEKDPDAELVELQSGLEAIRGGPDLAQRVFEGALLGACSRSLSPAEALHYAMLAVECLPEDVRELSSISEVEDPRALRAHFKKLSPGR